MLCALAAVLWSGVQAATLRGTGLRECFCPFLDKEVRYNLLADASWSLGRESAELSSTQIGATVVVSSHALVQEGKPTWIHNLTVANVSLVRSYKSRGSDSSTVLSGDAAGEGCVNALFVQRGCDKVDNIQFQDGCDANFLQGLASSLLFAAPLDELTREYINQGKGFHGEQRAHHTVRRWIDADQKKVIEVTRRERTRGGDLHLHGGTKARGVRDKVRWTETILKEGVITACSAE